jgi:hypothetical protein
MACYTATVAVLDPFSKRESKMKFMNTIVASLLVFSTTSFAAARVDNVRTPASVQAAVERIYELGRGEHDFGGISALRVYDVNGASERELPSIMTQIIATFTASEGEPLALGCNGGDYEDLVIRDNTACAAWLIANGRDRDAIRTIEIFKGTYPQNAAYQTDLERIKTYILRKVGHDYVEFTTSANLWSVDVSVSVMFNDTYTRAVVVFYDLGA